jgi:hypothetical protein
MDLYLQHGRKTPDERLEDWGSEGPRLKGVAGIHQTYGNAANVHFTDRAAMLEAQRLTGWEEWDDNALTMKWHEDMVLCVCDGVASYYGDWGLM